MKIKNEEYLYIPDDHPLISYVNIIGNLQTVIESGTDPSREVLKDIVRENITFNASESNIVNAIQTKEHIVGDTRIIDVRWNGVVSVKHKQTNTKEEIIEQSKKSVTTTDICTVTSFEYSASRIDSDFIAEDWKNVDRDDVKSHYFHKFLLVNILLTELDGKYVIIQMKPPVPSPYVPFQYWEYETEETSTREFVELLASIHGAFLNDIQEPVKQAINNFSFTGKHNSIPLDEERITLEFDDKEEKIMDSIPKMPLKKEQVFEVSEGYEEKKNKPCVLLIPDEPIFSDTIVEEMVEDVGGITAFTITDGEEVAVFRLELRESKVEWILREGSILD